MVEALDRDRLIEKLVESFLAKQPFDEAERLRGLLGFIKKPPPPPRPPFREERADFEEAWHMNEDRLAKLYAGPPLDSGFREMQIDELEGQQDAIEFVLGADGLAGSRRWSGAP